MLKKTVVIMVIAAMITVNLAATAGTGENPSTPAQPVQANNIKDNVQKRGRKEVRVKLHDGTELRGYIGNAGDHSFTLTDSATRQATAVSYADVETVKGKGLSTRTKVLIVAGIGLGILAVVVAVHAAHPFGNSNLGI